MTANGVSGSVADATTTPAITLTLGAITPSSVAATGAGSFTLTDAVTNTWSTVASLFHRSSGSPANGLGAALVLGAETSTTDDQPQVEIATGWDDVTHASRRGTGRLRAYKVASAYNAVQWGVDSGTNAPTVAFLNAAPSIQLVSPDLGPLATTFGFASGTPTFAAANITGASLPSGLVATQAEQETATSTVLAVTPGRQQFHPSAAKGWAFGTVAGGTPTLAANHNVSSIGDNGAGDFTVNWGTDFSTANYAATAWASGNGVIATDVTTQAADSLRLRCLTTVFVLADPTQFSLIAFGDQ